MSVQLDFSGEVVLVSGGATGLGLAIAHAFAHAGATIAVNDMTLASSVETSLVPRRAVES